MLVEGDPMSDISAVILWENNQNSPAPIPGFMDKLTSMNFTISISLTRPRKWKTYFGRYYHRHNHNPSVCLLDFRRYVVLSCTLPQHRGMFLLSAVRIGVGHTLCDGVAVVVGIDSWGKGPFNSALPLQLTRYYLHEYFDQMLTKWRLPCDCVPQCLLYSRIVCIFHIYCDVCRGRPYARYVCSNPLREQPEQPSTNTWTKTNYYLYLCLQLTTIYVYI